MALSIHVTRSPRRRRTASARLVGQRLEVRLPAGLAAAEEQRLVETLRRRFERRARRAAVADAGDTLRRRAAELNRRYFDGRLAPASVEYVANQEKRFGSCSLPSGRIRLSDRVAALPAWVRDYVLVHELAHLREPNHSPAFWRLVQRYPLAERARGYLMALGLESDGEREDDGPAGGAGVDQATQASEASEPPGASEHSASSQPAAGPAVTGRLGQRSLF